MIASVDVLIRWTDSSIGLTGWGWFALFVVLSAVSQIGGDS